MSGHTIETSLFDIFIAIKKIRRVLSMHSSEKELLCNFTSWDSVLRELHIIRVAGSKVINSNILRKEYQILIYLAKNIEKNYFAINSKLVWDMLINNSKNFENEIKKLINEIEASYRNELIDAFIDENYYLDFVVESLEKLRD